MKGNTKKRGSAWGGAKAAVWGLCVLALVFGFALAGCSDGSGSGGGGGGGGDDPAGETLKWPASFTGKVWTHDIDGYQYIKLEFENSDDYATMTVTTRGGSGGPSFLTAISGTTYTTQYSLTSNSFTATVEDNTLTISDDESDAMNGEYTGESE